MDAKWQGANTQLQPPGPGRPRLPEGGKEIDMRHLADHLNQIKTPKQGPSAKTITTPKKFAAATHPIKKHLVSKTWGDDPIKLPLRFILRRQSG